MTAFNVTAARNCDSRNVTALRVTAGQGCHVSGPCRRQVGGTSRHALLVTARSRGSQTTPPIIPGVTITAGCGKSRAPRTGGDYSAAVAGPVCRPSRKPASSARLLHGSRGNLQSGAQFFAGGQWRASRASHTLQRWLSSCFAHTSPVVAESSPRLRALRTSGLVGGKKEATSSEPTGP